MEFTGKHEPEIKSSNDNITKEELAATYKLIYTKEEEACMNFDQHMTTICVLHKENKKLTYTIIGLEEDVTWLNSKIEHMTKFIRMLNSGSNMLDEILDI